MTRPRTWTVLLLPLLIALALPGCRDEPATAPGDATTADGTAGQEPDPAAPVAQPPVDLKDVMERDPRYLIGISYPPGMSTHPGLAAALHAYAEGARAELLDAVGSLDAPPTVPYDLSLGFRLLLQTPQVIAVAADGSVYTGGAHGQPLVARFVWLVGREEMLTADRLVQDPRGWEVVARQVSEQLAASAQIRAIDGSLSPEERKNLLSSALRMIDEGTGADPENFAQFEPVPAADGRIAALRFVFPPYQVGPYADGVQYAEVPAATLLPYVAGEYRELFAQ
ncbi:hypothetical protein Psesu_1367 [Pseudoxanthomonas suwonensis 11-1]|uniref:DUF3298 domain-containing protein n=1 Tax=Pseudoxanthomonas suwonensis (strain 11-1) TaxID=743721 RepID=E6WSK0_PSEUU|nr:DUF3298 and DUF4163 domain-containing protein [Pseudoxanthomonas suwonensis]ADV27214.1 hypothetical protein Psesu_1367 [Pseudoxanthomonas suwonensis 11-1]